jgi:hypothetical protein
LSRPPKKSTAAALPRKYLSQMKISRINNTKFNKTTDGIENVARHSLDEHTNENDLVGSVCHDESNN